MVGFASSSRHVWRGRAKVRFGAFAAALALSTVVGCSRRDPASSVARAAPLDARVETARGPGASVDLTDPPRPALGSDAGKSDAESRGAPSTDAGDAFPAYAFAAPVGGKSVGHTSVVFKLALEGGLTVAYKPRSAHGDHRYRGEIAAYRLARVLGLDNVPLALPRAFDYGALQTAIGREPIFADVVKETDGTVRGAIMPWIKGLEFIPLENDEWMPKWRGWLKADGVIPAEERDLAAQISTVLAFDLVTGNWDRWSGGNIAIDRARGRLLYVDNDGAFFDPPPVKEMKRPTALFDGADRFSRRFVAALRTVDLAKAVGEEAPGEPLLSPHVLAQTDARRKHVLATIDARIAKLGEPAVLAFE
jgi:hypothetical protein